MSKKKQDKDKPKNVKHGIHTWLDQGRVNPSIRGYRKIQRHLEETEEALVNMQGGPDNITAAKQILIKSTVEAYGVILLASVYCKDKGLLRPDKLQEGVVELQPVLGSQFLSFLNTLRQNLTALGLEKEDAAQVMDIDEYVRQKYGDDDD